MTEIVDEALSDTEFTSKLILRNVTVEQHGNYNCSTREGQTNRTNLIVRGKPKVEIDVVKAVSTSEIFVNWTVHNGNSELTSFKLSVLNATLFNKHVSHE